MGDKDGRLQLVEAGAHRGELARDVLGWLRERRGELFAQMDYWIVEPSERRRGWQERTLAEFAGKIHWISHLAELARLPGAKGVRGAIFSNELLDAMPVHRLGWDAVRRQWFEWGVKWEGERFAWTRMPQGDVGWQEWDFGWADLVRNEALLAVLPDAFTLEVCPAAVAWWQQAARVLECGKLLTFDYGLRAEDLFVPERKEGTLRAYHQHQLADDVLAQPGQQDLTAHVNFTTIQAAGEAAGLKTLAFQTQGQFLTQIAAQVWNSGASFGDWTPTRTRQFQTLTHPEHLGRAFRVLVQGRE
ncbi:MAG TPA: SAM-dependent methyltransferase [Bacillota bacterium]|nr:SAM-dependent methyltransferase [Bacillota bacterium]